ncbi:Stk1 family PASTA domain-containing Ser/Thr kinase [Lentilactobacillus sp. SPB1-3]|uniref:Stk1 family PASTA domain-containing Ser/Thr kinase n=1 Tax=Lentilactobacillus terminaliae TaxID=3003483 RepID=A0ACD5DBX2_9LACO|nr:Stk1 family PASTA domain-containing Ser/Thr kinase [Lentilactobacillus sp. SPB1-3]MCZ0977170.1 Stk1 family PASTA domain-containing Ser/Thr kinase [Lentilactobacillus sp. SPB1-3]
MNSGYVLNGRYKIISRLGEGGMADVYLAQDLILDRKVAVKLLRLDFRDNPKAKRRFQNEALAVTQLNNSHIVGVYDVDEVEGMQYIVMEWVNGEDLKDYIKDYSPIPYATVVDIMEQICSAVGEAHRHGIIHRDLKPQNILINGDGYVKITDFGISRVTNEDTMTQTRSIIGSIHYLSPEQIKGLMATKRSDIYSLGIILYELLTGNVPFDGETAVSIAIKHSQESIPSVRDIDPKIPQPLENVVLKATAKDPNDRYDSVDELADDLKTSLSLDRLLEPRFEPNPKDNSNDKTRVMPFSPLQSTGLNSDKLAAKAAPEDSQDHEEKSDDTPKQKSKDKKPKKRRHHRRRWLILGGLLIILIIFGVLIATANGRTRVPQVTGLTESDAKQSLLDAHLKVGKITYKNSYSIDKNRVISSTPDEGVQLHKRDKVNLLLSSGVRTVKLDNYVGQSYNKVAVRLKNQGFKVKRRSAPSSSFAAGKILQQNFNPNRHYDPNKKTLTFVVSTGIKEITLKDLTGMTKDQVVDYTNKVKLNPTFDYAYSDDVPNGEVISQTPAADEQVQQGSSIMVYISRGKKTSNDLKSFSTKVTIPYRDDSKSITQSNNDSSISSDSTSGLTGDPVGNSSSSLDDQSSSQSKTENVILIYLKDHDHDLSKVYKQMVISRDTTVSLPFELTKDEIGKYKIVRDGKTILRDNNITYQMH